MKILRRNLVVYLSLSVTFSSLAIAQDRVKDSDVWLLRASTITDDLVRDAVSLAPNERALLWARMGRAWEKEDPNRAATDMRKAVEIVEFAPDGESAIERRQRFDTARSLLSIIPAQYDKLRLTLQSLFTPKEDRATDNGGRETADGLIAAAMGIVDTDPQGAFDLGMASLRIGRSYKLAALLWKLRNRDEKLADGLFDAALSAARTAFDPESLGWLSIYAFRDGQTPSDERRKALLGVIAQGLLRDSASAGGEAEVCKLAPTAATYLIQFNRLTPDLAIVVRQVLSACQSTLQPSERQSVDEALRDQPLKTVADLEDEADKAPREEIRDGYLIRAARLAAHQKNYEKAISLLDRISEQGRKQLGGGWESWRWSYAASAAVAQFRRGDRSSMNRIITATPEAIRGFVQIAVAQALVKAGDPDSAFDLLTEARKRLAQSSGTEVVDGYFSLMHQYESLAPIDTVNVFYEVVKALNRIEKSDSKGSQSPGVEPSLLSNDLLLGAYNVPILLLEKDESGVRAAISSIQSPSKRAAIRLNLLNSSLAQPRTVAPARKPAISETQPHVD
jgi:tetratricopeptide (TPR) repeat protein